jgi:hypothetical protein
MITIHPFYSEFDAQLEFEIRYPKKIFKLND